MSIQKQYRTWPFGVAGHSTFIPPSSSAPIKFFLIWFLIITALAWASTAKAQLDPERRTYLEAGAEHPLRGNGPLDGYLFLLVNRPQFPAEHWYSRVVLSPTYLRSELVRDRWPADGHAVGMGLDGGFFQNDFREYRDGALRKRESFWGGGGGARISYYWRPAKIAGLVPVEGMLRLRPEYAVYTRGMDTSRGFRLPADSAIYSARAGIRVGGVPPELFPDEALEVSLYHQISYRSTARDFGFPDQLHRTRHFTQKTWARAVGIFSPWLDHTVGLTVTGGIAQDTDALSVFRVGGPFRLLDELPLILHGYNPEELFARRFALVNLTYQLAPIPALDWFRLQLAGDYGHVRFFTGRSLPRNNLFGAGTNLIAMWDQSTTVAIGYGHGFDAPRGDRTGGHHVHLLLERKF